MTDLFKIKKQNMVGMLVLFICLILTGCTKKPVSEEKPTILCTIFPQYDWTREILGERVDDFNLELLIDDGTDSHSYQPTVEDIVTISEADMVIYIGGESDAWIQAAIDNANNPDLIELSMLDAVGGLAKEEEVKEGMLVKDEEDEESENEPEYDEHVWLSLKNAIIITEELEKCIENLDSNNADLYRANLKRYQANLSELDSRYKEAVGEADCSTLLFADRFPFRYMIDDYGLDYYAAFVGCSAESEASFETITFLANKVDELKLSTILQIESADGKIAETIKETTGDKNQNILTMDSMQSVTAKNVDDGATYLGIMADNLDVLEQAIN